MRTPVGKGSALIAGIGSGAIASQLPNTGSNFLIELSLAIAAALVVWSVLYAANQKARG